MSGGYKLSFKDKWSMSLFSAEIRRGEGGKAFKTMYLEGLSHSAWGNCIVCSSSILNTYDVEIKSRKGNYLFMRTYLTIF